MKNFYTFLIAILVSGLGFSQSPIVTIDRANGAGPTTTGTVANITAQGLTRGAGIVQQGGSGTDFISDNWIPGSAQRNVDEYVQWSVTAVGDFQAVISALEIQLSRGANGPVNWQIFYSLDGFADPASGTDVTGLQTATTTSSPFSFAGLNINSGVSGTITFRLYAWGATSATGILTIEGNSAWQGTLGVPNPGVRLTGNVNLVDLNTEVIRGTQPSGAVKDSKLDTPAEAFPVIEFDIEDKGSGTIDGFPTNVTNIRLTPHSTNTALWSQTIESVLINDGSTDVSGNIDIPSIIPTNSVTVTDSFIDIDVAGELNIADGATQTIVVWVYFKADGQIVDNSTISFFINAAASGFTADPFGSGFASLFSNNVTSEDFQIDIQSSQLTYLVQPVDVTIGSLMPAVQIAFTDENGNVDSDADGVDFEISLTSTGNLSLVSSRDKLAENGIATFDDLFFLSQGTDRKLIMEDFSFDSVAGGGFYDSELFDVAVLPSQTTFEYTDGSPTGSWFPSDPNLDAVSTDIIEIVSGDASITLNTDIFSVTVNEGASLTVNSGVTFRVIDNMTLESSSTNYSSFIFNGIRPNPNQGTVVGGTIKYKRFVNANTPFEEENTGGGNDLISAPLTGQNWNNFLNSDAAANKAALLNNGDPIPDRLYAFAPFVRTNGNPGQYVNWADNSIRVLTSGLGYRAATVSDVVNTTGQNLIFTGDVRTEAFTVNLSVTGTDFAEWNLVGNPYPSYLNIADLLAFVLQEAEPGIDEIRNVDLFAAGGALYGYDGDDSDGTWNTITLLNAEQNSLLMAPGQGFYVAAKEGIPGGTTILSGLRFDPSMRSTGSSDDFILGRNSEVSTYLKLSASTATKSYMTEFYFTDKTSLGLDQGYDGKILGAAPNFALYSHLVEENTGLQIAIQGLHTTDLVSTTVIPLGVNSNAGEQITFSITESTLPDAVEVYLEDTVTNTFTLLNTGDYILTPSANLNGTGRFYLRFSEGALSITETTLANLNIYSNPSDKTIVIAGQLLEATTASVFDLQGRLVNTTHLVTTSRSQTIDVSNLSSGVYVVQLNNGTQNKTQKVILR